MIPTAAATTAALNTGVPGFAPTGALVNPESFADLLAAARSQNADSFQGLVTPPMPYPAASAAASLVRGALRTPDPAGGILRSSAAGALPVEERPVGGNWLLTAREAVFATDLPWGEGD